jgi:hypothetical protein
MSGYVKLKEEALDSFVWRTRFGWGCGTVVRQITEWMKSLKIIEHVSKRISQSAPALYAYRRGFEFMPACRLPWQHCSDAPVPQAGGTTGRTFRLSYLVNSIANYITTRRPVTTMFVEVLWIKYFHQSLQRTFLTI